MNSMADTRPVIRIAAPLRQQVAEFLREDIVRGEFAPGERLIERDLCERYAVSRTVVREVLRQVEADGLITMVANKGPEVATVSRADVVALYEVRTVLESLAGQLFAERASEDEKRQLAENIDAFAEAIGRGAIAEALETKDAFYDTLFAGSRNATIASTLRTLNGRIQLMRALSLGAPDRGQQTLTELREILSAVQDGDGRRAWEACERHVRAAAQTTLRELDARVAQD